jgi:ubiquinone/menaquinone biosynthesis C-methylase UbiE
MSVNRSDKELAFLHDLYVEGEWGERFAELIDEHVEPPKQGRGLYVAAGTGGHALKIAERAERAFTLIGVDEHAERVEIARAKAAAAGLKGQTDFRVTQLETLDFEDDQFELVVGDASLVAAERLPEMLAEMARVAAPGGTVALALPTASSHGEFFSVYWEAMLNAGLGDRSGIVEDLITGQPTITDAEEWAAREGLEAVRSWTNVAEFTYASAEEFFAAPLVKDFLLGLWLEPIEDESAHERVVTAAAAIIDEERAESPFVLSIKATLVVGRKPSD